MKKAIKIIVAVALICVAAGVIISFIGFAASGFDINALNGNDIVTEKYTLTGTSFEEIRIDTSVVDVEVIYSPTATEASVTFVQDKSLGMSVSEEGGVLTVHSGKRAWYKSFGLFWGECTVTVCLPNAEQGSLEIISETGSISVIGTDLSFTDVSLESDTGDVVLTSVGAGKISAGTDTGDVVLTSVGAGKISVETDTGDIEMHRVVATEYISLTSDTGDIELERSDAPDIRLESDTGDVEAALLSGKQFTADSSTGDVRIPASDPTGGVCNIKTATGDIEVKIVG